METGTGFKFGPYEAARLLEKYAKPFTFIRGPEQWQKIQHNGMLVDNSWEAAAKKYIELYQGDGKSVSQC
jgi:starch synthase